MKNLMSPLFMAGIFLTTSTVVHHRSAGVEEQQSAFKAGIDAGLKRNVSARHIEVQVYGNLTAVATNYVVGNLTPSGGSPQQILRRRTAVLIKQGGQWKIVHRHISSLTLP